PTSRLGPGRIRPSGRRPQLELRFATLHFVRAAAYVPGPSANGTGGPLWSRRRRFGPHVFAVPIGGGAIERDALQFIKMLGALGAVLPPPAGPFYAAERPGCGNAIAIDGKRPRSHPPGHSKT